MTNTVSKTISDETLNCIVQIESGGNPNAKAATSSALGLGQFLNQTWLNVVEKHRADVMSDRTTNDVLAMRRNASLSIEMLARFTEDNLKLVGRGASGGDLYLAHFLGAGDAHKVSSSDPTTLLEELLDPRVINANKSIMAGKTCAQLRAWSARRMHEAGGHAWVAKYYIPPDEEPLPDEPEPEQVPEDAPAEDIPDPQKPETVPVPKPRPTVGPTIHHDDVRPTPRSDGRNVMRWIRDNGVKIGSWASIGGLSTGGLSLTSDWRIVAVVVGGVIVMSGIIGAVYLISSRRAA